MKRVVFLLFTISAFITFCGCQPELKSKKIVGQWKQTAIKSQIGDGEPEIITEETVWTFNDDSTCTIAAEDEIDTGTWALDNDSSLIIRMDSITSSYKVMRCDNDSLIQRIIVDSDFGQITETTTLIKE
ncbi:MAG: lipocalin family protein [Bacteroidaceae bacterium]|nr:lipocalin family protein [Bacteroidaceae bacterium]